MSKCITFQLNEKERQKALEWQEKHLAECGPFPEVTGARWQYSFVPTGIGTIVHVQCLKCHVEHDCTDYGPTIGEPSATQAERPGPQEAAHTAAILQKVRETCRETSSASVRAEPSSVPRQQTPALVTLRGVIEGHDHTTTPTMHPLRSALHVPGQWAKTPDVQPR